MSNPIHSCCVNIFHSIQIKGVVVEILVIRSLFKGVLIDFKAPLLFADLWQVYLLDLSFIHYLESLDGILPIFIVEITHLIKANQRQSLF